MRWPKVSNTSPRRITLPSARQIQTVNYRAVAKGTPGLFDIGLHGREKKGKLKFGDFAFCLCSLLPVQRGYISGTHCKDGRLRLFEGFAHHVSAAITTTTLTSHHPQSFAKF